MQAAPLETRAAKPKRTGVSLTQDAWRRLKKNRLAMACLMTLVTVALLALFTPLLPLAPPDADNTRLKLAPPSGPLIAQTEPLTAETLHQYRQAADEARAELRDLLERPAGWLSETEKDGLERQIKASLTELLIVLQRPAGGLSEEEKVERGRQIAVIRAQLASLLGRLAGLATEEEITAHQQLIKSARKRISDLVQRPYQELGYPHLDALARWMVRARYAVFGDATIGPICGRDILGRDILSRIFWGARVSLIVGIVATIVSLVIGVTYGAVSGYVGGWVDDAMMRVVDVLYSIPFIFVVIFIITILAEDSIKDQLESYGIDRITIFYLVVGAIYWLTMARVVRGQVISLRNEPFVEAARALGVTQTGVIFRHILPNLFSVVIVYLTLTIPRVILFEAFLSFLGLGVEPPDVSWGLLANEGIKVITPVRIYWWLIVFPSLAIGLTLFALNFLGDGLRDAFDPRLRDR